MLFSPESPVSNGGARIKFWQRCHLKFAEQKTKRSGLRFPGSRRAEIA
jgi:hypothetical protein